MQAVFLLAGELKAGNYLKIWYNCTVWQKEALELENLERPTLTKPKKDWLSSRRCLLKDMLRKPNNNTPAMLGYYFLFSVDLYNQNYICENKSYSTLNLSHSLIRA